MHYFGIDIEKTYKKAINSPLRRDIHPSCGFFYTKSGTLLFKDFAQDKTYTVIGMISKKYKETIWQTIKRINKDLELNLIPRYSPRIRKEIEEHNQETKEEIKIKGKLREWEDYDREYWGKYGIQISTLKLFNVFPIQRVYIYNKLKYRNTPTNPIYAYLIEGRIKIYRPLSTKSDKWRTDIPHNKFFGINLIPFIHDHCFIVSSLKEVMVLYELGFVAIAPQQETHKVITYSGFSSVDNPIFLFDYDNTGREVSFKLHRKGFPIYFTGDDNAKDIADYRAKYGKEETINLLNKILNNERRNLTTALRKACKGR